MVISHGDSIYGVDLLSEFSLPAIKIYDLKGLIFAVVYVDCVNVSRDQHSVLGCVWPIIFDEQRVVEVNGSTCPGCTARVVKDYCVWDQPAGRVLYLMSASVFCKRLRGPSFLHHGDVMTADESDEVPVTASCLSSGFAINNKAETTNVVSAQVEFVDVISIFDGVFFMGFYFVSRRGDVDGTLPVKGEKTRWSLQDLTKEVRIPVLLFVEAVFKV